MQRILLSAFLVLAWAGTARAGIIYLYSGDAAAAVVDVERLGVSQELAATGELPPTGGSIDATLASAKLDIDSSAVTANALTVATLHSSVSGAGGVTNAASVLANLSLLDGLVTADAVQSNASAFVGGATGGTDIINLSVAGVSIEVTGEANQVVNVLGLGTLTINEQSLSLGVNSSTLLVNALHLSMLCCSASPTSSSPTPLPGSSTIRAPRYQSRGL